jgi:hypothetical protein
MSFSVLPCDMIEVQGTEHGESIQRKEGYHETKGTIRRVESYLVAW